MTTARNTKNSYGKLDDYHQEADDDGPFFGYRSVSKSIVQFLSV